MTKRGSHSVPQRSIDIIFITHRYDLVIVLGSSHIKIDQELVFNDCESPWSRFSTFSPYAGIP